MKNEEMLKVLNELGADRHGYYDNKCNCEYCQNVKKVLIKISETLKRIDDSRIEQVIYKSLDGLITETIKIKIYQDISQAIVNYLTENSND